MPEGVIVSNPRIMSGTPCFRGTRVPFQDLMDYLEGGHSLDEFLDQFPTVSREMAIQALEEARDSLFARTVEKHGREIDVRRRSSGFSWVWVRRKSPLIHIRGSDSIRAGPSALG